MPRKMIAQLEGIPGLKLECPRCEESFSVKRAKLFGMYDSYPNVAREAMRARVEAASEMKSDLKGRRKRLMASKKARPVQITIASEATNYGQIGEQIIPAFQGFPYRPSECRPLFKPIDYIVFRGLAKKGRVEALTFVDVKTGGGQLTAKQRQIRDCIAEGKLEHRVIDQ
jgi:predicted Holliday junction resolvase-like endonuclease